MKESSGTDNVEIKVSSKLNVHAPIFEPKKIITTENFTGDEINSKNTFKSTMFISPPRQHMLNYPNYIFQNQMQFPMKIDCSGGAYTVITLPAACVEPQSLTNASMLTSHDINISSKTESSPTVVQNGIVAVQTSVNSDRYIPTMSNASSVSSITANNMPLIISQNNLSPMLWHGCAPTPSVALMPSYYSPINNMYVIRPPMYAPIASLSVPQNKSHLKTNIRNKVFNTGDVEQDIILNHIVQTINPLDEFVFRSKNCRFFVIKSFTEDNIYQAIRHGVWCSTPSGNDTLLTAYNQVKSQERSNDETSEAHVFLFFSVNGSGYFCGVAEMTSDLNTHTGVNIWNQKKWQTQFKIRWLYIKDIPNSYLRHIKLESNDNRPVTNCRDATEVQPLEKGIEVLRIIHNLDYDSCLLNDFSQDSGKIDKG